MIWLASFPRSGNTFFRNVLFDVYGISSSTFHRETLYPMEENYFEYPVVKTHLLPHELEEPYSKAPKVYLVRDGRDALVSMAHHRKDIIEPGTDFEVNLLEATLAMEGSYFGGWSENVRQWTAVADVVIHFEDLIANPLREVEKLRAIMDLPEPNTAKLPTFQNLKFGQPQYGSGKQFLDDLQEIEDLAEKNFRKGKAGAWREEMSPKMEKLFWELHGQTMESMGYERGEGCLPVFARKTPMRVLLESTKIDEPGMDGVKRYNEELLLGLNAIQQRQPEKWQLDVLIHRSVFPINFYARLIQNKREAVENNNPKAEGVPSEAMGYERLLLQIKFLIKRLLPEVLYRPLSAWYRHLRIRELLRQIRQFFVFQSVQKYLQTLQYEFELIHIPLPQNYQSAEKLNMPMVFTVHDLTHRHFPEFHEQANIDLADRGMQFTRDKRTHLIAVSDATRQDILAEYGQYSNEIHRIYEAADTSRFYPRKDDESLRFLRQKYQLPHKPYLLCLFTLEPRKNVLRTIEAFLQLMQKPALQCYTMVICGKQGWKLELPDHLRQHTNHIHFTGFVDDADLPALYSHAESFCYAAHYEGFGLPLLEAMQCGTPVIYGNNSSMPEVVGQGGLGVNSNDTLAISEAMERLLTDQELRNQLGQQARQQARRFSWIKTAFETMHVYEQIIAHENRHPGRPN
jgi:glycosyltransferase involved in cell wall biosynthesis